MMLSIRNEQWSCVLLAGRQCVEVKLCVATPVWNSFYLIFYVREIMETSSVPLSWAQGAGKHSLVSGKEGNNVSVEYWYSKILFRHVWGGWAAQVSLRKEVWVLTPSVIPADTTAQHLVYWSHLLLRQCAMRTDGETDRRQTYRLDTCTNMWTDRQAGRQTVIVVFSVFL